MPILIIMVALGIAQVHKQLSFLRDPNSFSYYTCFTRVHVWMNDLVRMKMCDYNYHPNMLRSVLQSSLWFQIYILLQLIVT